MRRLPILLLSLAASMPAEDAAPRISSIANAASLHRPSTDVDEPGPGVAGASIIAIFGENLSRSTVTPDGFPLPVKLAETSVTIGGIVAPLFFVSPSQINAMVPTGVGFWSLRLGELRTAPVVVQAGAQATDPYPLRIKQYGLGVFTRDSSGCGQGQIYQRAPDGSVSLNGPDNSADPGKSILTVIATGAGLVWPVIPIPPDGEPTPPSRLPTILGPNPFIAEKFTPFYHLYEQYDPDSVGIGGRLPGTVATDFRTFRLPENVPEGCAIPLRLHSEHNMSQNVTFSVRRGGGPCVDPPVERIALLTWERSVTSGLEPESVTEELRLEFLEAPGKSLPVREIIPESFNLGMPVWAEMEGPSCPLPVDTRLDAGRITASGPGWGPVTAVPAESNGYRIALPGNAIRAGTFVVRGAGGRDVGPFETTLKIPTAIQPEPLPPGTRIPAYLRAGGRAWFRWTGGDETSWVRVGVLSRPVRAERGDWLHEADRLASRGEVSFWGAEWFGLAPAPDAEVSFTQEAVTPVKFDAPGLTRGGLHRWVYRWRFTGLKVTGVLEFDTY
jgi:uncharacterized protein (TIGR03437 family)